ncbi:hypothetical protein [Leuconostoc lactis]|uniref:hypothetical protein n=1 Tax=Leuconostoc lactis TaxID=1246 RepID=UPI0011BB38DE|nr:hypothetical protein [Leuconostoc lactis]QEA50607.1 hypothetical protein FGL78_02560 [Leuconostoc lactis]
MFKKHTRSKKFVLTLLLLPVLSFAGFAATTYFFGVLSPSTNIGALTTASQGLSGSMQAIQDALTGLTTKFNTEQQNHQDDLAQAQIQKANDNIKAANAAVDAANTALNDPKTGTNVPTQQAIAANANTSVTDRTVDVDHNNAKTSTANP